MDGNVAHLVGEDAAVGAFVIRQAADDGEAGNRGVRGILHLDQEAGEIEFHRVFIEAADGFPAEDRLADAGAD